MMRVLGILVGVLLSVGGVAAEPLALQPAEGDFVARDFVFVSGEKLEELNSADDFINPPELAIAEREAKRLKRGAFVLLPASEETRGHGSHTWAKLWQRHLAALLAK